jgi:hypothetical protein
LSVRFERRIMDPMLNEIDARLDAAGPEGRPLKLSELEGIYTTGCAEILELEADALRIERRVTELRRQLRHVRTAIEWLQEQDAAGAADAG